MIEAPTHALRVTILRTICIGATFGLAALGLLGNFEPSSVRVIILVASALSGAMAIAKFVVPKLPDAVVRIYLVLLAGAIFVTALTVQPFQHLSMILLLGGAVAVCSFEWWPVAIAASGFDMLLGSVAIIYRSETPVAALIIFVSVMVLCVTSVLGYRRLSSAAIADAMHDPLTGLANRRGMEVGLPILSAVAQRGDYFLGCLSIDLDNFKSINDRFGHPRGDRILARTARTLEDRARKGDLLVRLGGEEFVLFSLVTSETELRALAENLRAAVESVEQPSVTVSIGGSLARTDSVDADEVLRRADAAMYNAKRAGRNRVVIE